MIPTVGSAPPCGATQNIGDPDFSIELANSCVLQCRKAADPAALLRDLGQSQNLISLSAPQARRLLDDAVAWIVSLKTSDDYGLHALAVVERGRLRSGLSITLLKPPPADADFWRALVTFAHRLAATSIQVEVVADVAGACIPTLVGEASRYEGEHLYVIDLQRQPRQLSTNTKRNINKARKAGASLIALPNQEALAAHFRLTGASLGRRAERGEDVGMRASQECVRGFLDRGLGRLYQAGVEGEVMSSKFVFFHGKEAFYYDGGTSAVGMEGGLSHFLMFQIVEALREEGYQSLNLDLARAGNTGLMRYKEGFDPQLWYVHRVTANRSTIWAMVRNAVQWR
jgi:hypothetical protein